MFTFCVFARNTGCNAGAIGVFAAYPSVANCTIVQNTATGDAPGGAIHSATLVLEVSNTIIAFNTGGCGIIVAGSEENVWIACSNIAGNEAGDWVEPLDGKLGYDGNISGDPLFLDLNAGDYRLSPGSPCCPDSSGCGLMGALPANCE